MKPKLRKATWLIILAVAVLFLAVSIPIKYPFINFRTSPQNLQSTISKGIDLNTYFEKGYNLIQDGRYNDAIKFYNRIIQTSPNDPDIYYNLGLSYYNLGNYVNSIKMFRKALKFDKQDPCIYYNLGLLYAKKNILVKSIQQYKKAIDLDPNYINAYYNLGIVYGMVEKWNDVVDIYKRLLKIQPNDMDAHYNLALACIIAKENKLFAKEYKILKTSAPDLASDIHQIMSKG